MAFDIGDHMEMSSDGWFNTRGETADMFAVASMGLWYGFAASALTIALALVTKVRSKLRLTAGTK